MANKPKRPCAEPGCNDMGFIKRDESDPGPLVPCPKCVVPFITERRPTGAAPRGTRENNWGMPAADAGMEGPKATETRRKKNETSYGFQG